MHKCTESFTFRSYITINAYLDRELKTMKADLEQFQQYGNFGFWELDIQKDHLFWSNQVYIIFGKSQENFNPTLESFTDSVHPDDRASVREAYDNSLKNKTQYAIEHRIVLNDGSIKYVSEHCDTIYDDQGNPIKSMGIVKDITERVEALRKLRESEEKFSAISKQTTEGITVADMDGNYVYVNPAFCKMSGYTEQELLQMTVFDMKAPDQDHSSFKESKTKMEGKPLRVNLKRMDGSVYFTEIVGNVIHLDNKTLVLGTIRDVSDRVQYEREIENLNQNLEKTVVERTKELKETVQALNNEIAQRAVMEEQLRDTLELKSILLKEITHRVKNNMQIISSIISLQKDQLPKGTHDFMDQIKNRIHSMALIHETLYKNNDYKVVDFEKYTTSLLKYLSDFYSHENIKVQCEVMKCKLPLDVATNCGMILMELLTNAIKYAFPNGREGLIEVKFGLGKDDRYELSISDNGIGFPKTKDFKQSKTLGLQLVSNLTDQLEGEVIQEVNGGTKYTITFEAPHKLASQ